jgi:hypothetical protein
MSAGEKAPAAVFYIAGHRRPGQCAILLDPPVVVRFNATPKMLVYIAVKVWFTHIRKW